MLNGIALISCFFVSDGILAIKQTSSLRWNKFKENWSTYFSQEEAVRHLPFYLENSLSFCM